MGSGVEAEGKPGNDRAWWKEAEGRITGKHDIKSHNATRASDSICVVVDEV